MKMRNMLEGFGAALLILLPYYCKFLLPTNLDLYYLSLPVTNRIEGLLIDMVFYSVLAIGILVAVQYLPTYPRRIVGAVFTGLMLWVVVDFVNMVLLHLQYRIYSWNQIWWESALAIPIVCGAFACFFSRITQKTVWLARLTLAGFAFSGAWIVPQLLHIALARQPDNHASSAHSLVPMVSNNNQRIIWILFDELSYNQTFDHPAPGIQLPNFDKLRAKSVSFGDLKPLGFYTDHIIPSLFLGERIDQIRATIKGELWYRDEAQRRWLAYDPNATLFAVAQRSGWSTGVAGWVIPYCRTLAPVLNICSWEPLNILPNSEYNGSEEKSALANALVLPNRFMEALVHRTKAPQSEPIVEVHIPQYRDIMAHARTLIDDSQVRFVFLHIPLPHPPGRYDRKRHMLSTEGTYLDNLVFADDTLGVLMQEIYATPSSTRTAVIISSDHSWRIPLWRNSQFWSDEEERASGGRFDDRPVLLIHFPGQKSGSDVDAAQPELIEHDIIADMLKENMNNPEQLAIFLSQHGR